MRILSQAQRALLARAPKDGQPSLFRTAEPGTGKRPRGTKEQPAPKSFREAQRQAAIVAALKLRGYSILQTSEHRTAVQCPHCSGWHIPRGGRKIDPGIPDLLVTSCRWPDGSWLGLEVKADASSPLRPAQKELSQAGRIFVVWEVGMALAAIELFEERLQERGEQ